MMRIAIKCRWKANWIKVEINTSDSFYITFDFLSIYFFHYFGFIFLLLFYYLSFYQHFLLRGFTVQTRWPGIEPKLRWSSRPPCWGQCASWRPETSHRWPAAPWCSGRSRPACTPGRGCWSETEKFNIWAAFLMCVCNKIYLIQKIQLSI